MKLVVKMTTNKSLEKAILATRIGAGTFLLGLTLLGIGVKLNKEYLKKLGCLTYGLGAGTVMAGAYSEKNARRRK